MSRPAFVERERKAVVTRSRIGEVVFGVQDGITTTVGVVTSMVAAHQSNAATLFIGTASACAGMFSMAIGSYLSSKAELDVARIELSHERARIAGKRAHEIHELAQI
jgi:VIT1/CCC1 family predicted Fe2+/Mn2+ transporter